MYRFGVRAVFTDAGGTSVRLLFCLVFVYWFQFCVVVVCVDNVILFFSFLFFLFSRLVSLHKALLVWSGWENMGVDRCWRDVHVLREVVRRRWRCAALARVFPASYYAQHVCCRV